MTHQCWKTIERILYTVAAANRAEYEFFCERIAANASSPPQNAASAGAKLSEAGSMLRAERLRQGMSLYQLQEATGIMRSTLSSLETQKNGNPKIGTLEQVATALGKRLVVALVDQECSADQVTHASAKPELEQVSS